MLHQRIANTESANGIHGLFAQQVERSPERIALIWDDTPISYGELAASANRLANYLVRSGVSKNQPVGVLLDRSIDMVVAVLAVLQLGAVYVPMDTTHPRGRLDYIVEDACLKFLITSSGQSAQVHPRTTKLILLDRLADAIRCEASTFSAPPIAPEDPAYIVYTSGSTGVPKGVLIPHRVFVRCRWWAKEVFGFTAADRFLFKSFRAPEELFFPVSIGAAAIIVPDDADRDSALLVGTILRHSITVLGLSPAVLTLLASEPRLEQCGSLKQVFSSGEALSVDTANRFLRHSGAALFNFYGLAEAPYTALWKCRAAEALARLPIGHPPDADLRVLGRDLEPLAPGEIGELHVGGPGLALRYLNLPDLTAQRFIEKDGCRLYRTGDLGYCTEEGIFFVTGRTDFQVKVRGFRLELEEVETVLCRHPALKTAPVVVREGVSNQPELIAYLVMEGDAALTVEEMRSFLEQALPDYAIPSHLRVVSSLPLTSTGKVDRVALKNQSGLELPRTTAYAAPRDEHERQLTNIWQELLGQTQIGINDNFFHLGGHSLAATQVVARIRAELGVELPLRDLFEAPTIGELATRLSRAVPIKSPVFFGRTRSGAPEFSFAQERLWFLDRLEPESSAYHIPDAYLVNGPLDIAVLERSLRAVGQRHELLRTTLQLIDGRLVQVIAPKSDLTIASVDRCGLSEIEQELEIERQIKENSAIVFDLAQGPLLQLKVVRLATNRYLLLVNMHHIVSDDWSLGVFYRELSAFYAGFLQGISVDLPALPIQYADYAICQREWFKEEVLECQLAYWRDQLSAVPTLELPTDFPRPPRQTFVGTRMSFTLSADLTARLKAFNRWENATPFMSLLATFQILLSRYSGQTDIAVGTPIANRRHVELEGLFGFFVNMLVLRGDLSGEPGFREIVSQIRRHALDAYQHQDLPFEKLVEDLNPQRDLSRSPVFQVMFALQDVPTHPLAVPGATVSRRVHVVHATHFDLELYLSNEGEAWSGFFGYNTDLFAPATIERMIGHYQTLLESLLIAPDVSVFRAEMLPTFERQQLLAWNNSTANYGSPECLHQLFEEQAARSPDSIAIEYENRVLTYRELNSRADSLARELQAFGVGLETRVGVCVERSLEMVVALLAILKSGASYVPIDIHFPPERVAFILKDAEVTALILHESLRSLCVGFAGPVIPLDPERAGEPTSPVNVSVAGTDAAYVYYTSGSTGRPKGIVIEHRSVMNFLRAMQTEPGIRSSDVLLALTTISFDPAVLDIFLPLSVGARIVIVPEATRLDPDQLLELLHRSGATMLQATPTTWQLLMRTKWTRKDLRALIGGEILTPELAREILSRCRELWNLYGPTETTVWSTVGRVHNADDITIGRTIPNQRAYIVDPRNQPVAVGVPGELLIGGAGVGRFYVSQPALTAERFIPDPFSPESGALVYRTGDLCRYRPDGRMEFLGRVDQQIKIRGFRVEPGEIEALLVEHPSVNQCVVVDRLEKSGDRRLIGYIVPADPSSIPDVSELREFLRRKLPDYMLPASFVVLEKLPLTRSGKVQRNALPAPQSVRQNNGTMPRNAVERQIVQIWENVLEVRGIGLTDDFFEIGGHSLMAVRLMAEINAAFAIHLPLATIFRAPTVENLAIAIQASEELRLKPPGLIEPRQDETGQRIFWAPSVGSVERFVECHNLARLLRGEYRFCGFDPAPEIAEITSLARHCVKLIRGEQPRGPYFLAGYCQCGHVAYEIATQLERDGEEVSLLAIIDCSARDLAFGFRQRLYWIRDGLRRHPRLALSRMRSLVQRKLWPAKGLTTNNGIPENQFIAHGRAANRHKARRFPGTVDLFRSGEWLSRFPHAPKLGWDALARTVRVHPVSCGHIAMLSDPAAAQIVAERLKEFLQCQAA